MGISPSSSIFPATTTSTATGDGSISPYPTCQMPWRSGRIFAGNNLEKSWRNSTFQSPDTASCEESSPSFSSILCCPAPTRSIHTKNNRVTIIFHNEMDCDLCLCWIDFQGTPHHFRVLRRNASLRENSLVGHTFLMWRIDDDDDWEVRNPKIDDHNTCTENYGEMKNGNKKRPAQQRLKKESVICRSPVVGYRALRSISLEKKMNSNSISRTTIMDRPHILHLRENGRTICRTIAPAYNAVPFDTTKKVYEEVVIECKNGAIRWTLMCEPGWENQSNNALSSKDMTIRERLIMDLNTASDKLPQKACELLSKSIRIWVNVSQKYGMELCPTEASHMCFHPGMDWLRENGMKEEKCHGIEIYRVKDYLADCDLWGAGGVILHELSHAWHCCFCENGYDNKDIIQCFDEAMCEELYESVKVHGPQGPKAKAYACTNAMEYFAELSVAFMCQDQDLEYNKWYPFNRRQLMGHDRRAFELMCECWGVPRSKT